MSNSSLDNDAEAEKRLVRKMDLTVFPILFVVYMLSFLDRINISNARIQGMTQDLDLTGNRFNIALFVYFVPYILLEVPSNMIIRKMRPSLYLGGLMFCWGIVNMCMGFVKSYGALVGLRFLLGVFEAGVMPGVVYLISMYYKRHELQIRMSFFFSSTLFGGAFGGLLAYAIAHLGGRAGMAAWRWIFIIEGAITAVVSVGAAFLIVDWPEQCKFLSPEELALLKKRLAADGGDIARMDTLNPYAYKLILSDWKIWLSSFVYMGIGITGYSTTFFMPTILKEFGWTAESAQVHTIPVYVVSGAGMLLAAWASDRLHHRYGFIMLGALLSTIGYGVLLSQQQHYATLSSSTKYGAVFLAALGGYIGTPIALAWLANNLSGHWKRAFGSGIQITVGNVVGIIASNIFVEHEAPTYRTGYGVALGLTWFGALTATVLALLLWRENRLRRDGKRDGRIATGTPKEEIDNMGDYHPAFRFTI
ncbi:putative major facilitator superfamily protein [Eutypa lata UCREL1]|uniref:Putative major facilitator superfamily protein n=1 Tax=Eutypa lata (strain UCR-EL1) TaxID=1287681 RepID=M7TRV6_EUTLA|nr:putative major facilitator superfamily protein [Eutypa lata UCREL1]